MYCYTLEVDVKLNRLEACSRNLQVDRLASYCNGEFEKLLKVGIINSTTRFSMKLSIA